MDLYSGYPFWLLKDGLLFSYPKLKKNTNVDVTIIGAGISGALSAYYLSKTGLSCLIVDKAIAGLGSTCASTSLIQYELDIPLYKLSGKIGYTKAQRIYNLCYEAIDELNLIAEKINFKGFEKAKSLYFAANKKDIYLLEKEFANRKKSDFKVKWLDHKDVFHKYGIHAPAALLSEQGGSMDAYEFTHALLRYCIEKKLSVYERTEITAIEQQKESIELRTADGFRIKSRYVINASGYEAAKALPKDLVKFYSTYAVVSEPLDKGKMLKKKYIAWNTASPYLYFRTTNDNRIIVGGRDEPFISEKKMQRLNHTKTKLLANDFKQLFPAVHFIPEFSWSGVFVVSKDSLPYIGCYKNSKNIFYALGFGGNGITFSAIAGRIIRNMILEKRDSNSSLFSFDR